MTETLSFGPVAPYYDELMRAVPYRMWVSYYLLLLSMQQVQPKKILDICCGTGTMCEMLQDEGREMAGFDLAPGMIAIAKRKAAKKKLPIPYHVADATNFDLGETYDGALSFFDSLNNILDADALANGFKCMAKHLKPGGSLIFDLNMAYAFEASLFDQEQMRKNAKLRYQWFGDWDPEARIITVNMTFWYKGDEFHEVHRQRAYDTDEIFEMLEDAGFEELRAYHSYTLDPPRYKSDRVHFTAIRG